MAEVAELRTELKQQKAINRELLKRLYGSRSEQMDSNQLLLLLSEDEAKKPIAAETGGDEPEAETRKPVQGSSIVEKPFRFRFQWVGTAIAIGLARTVHFIMILPINFNRGLNLFRDSAHRRADRGRRLKNAGLFRRCHAERLRALQSSFAPSIRAPRVRGDRPLRGMGPPARRFNPRPSCEGRPQSPHISTIAPAFQFAPLV